MTTGRGTVASASYHPVRWSCDPTHSCRQCGGPEAQVRCKAIYILDGVETLGAIIHKDRVVEVEVEHQAPAVAVLGHVDN